MKLKINYWKILFVSIAFLQGCGGSENNKPAMISQDRPKEACSQLDKASCLQPDNFKCYYDGISNKCESKLSLRAQDVVATAHELVVLTKDGYIYRQGLIPGLGSEKALAVAAGFDFCHIKEDNTLQCQKPGWLPIPPGTKAQQVSLADSKYALCYIDMDDKINCLSSLYNLAPNPRYGVASNLASGFKLFSKDYSNSRFSSVSIDKSSGNAACGRLKDSGEIVCFSNRPTMNSNDLGLRPIDKGATGYALLFGSNYYIDSHGIIKSNEPSGRTGLRVDNFVAQGTLGIGPASSLKAGTLVINNSGIPALCFISNKKVYCSSDKQNLAVDLRNFNPVNPAKITLSKDIICAINAEGAFRCANITGKGDDARLKGF